MAVDSQQFRRVLGHYPTGVCLITAMSEEHGPLGMIVGSFSSVSLDPPLVGFFPDCSSTSWPKVQETGRFCVNVLAANQQEMCRDFAMRKEDKFANISYRLSPQGLPVVDDAVAWIECDLHAVHDAGDHFLVLGEVLSLDIGQPRSPLLFFQGGYGQFAPQSDLT